MKRNRIQNNGGSRNKVKGLGKNSIEKEYRKKKHAVADKMRCKQLSQREWKESSGVRGEQIVKEK